MFVLMSLIGLLAAGALLLLFFSNKKKTNHKKQQRLRDDRHGREQDDASANQRARPDAAAKPVAQSAALPAVAPRPSFADQAAAQRAEMAARQPHRAAPPTPQVLLDFVWQRAESLSAQRKQALLDGLGKTVPPSRAFHQLISPEFVARASSSELSDLVLGEPQVAARVLVLVNSAIYGLQTPVSGVGQAVTFMGLNSVRSICLQYMLSASFKAENPAQQQRFDAIWLASAVASELCFRLAQQLRLPNPGTLVTQVVLSFLGHFAAAASMPKQGAVPATEPQSLLARAQLQQTRLGAPAAEIGGLLLREWALPESLIADVVDIDRLLVTPPDANPAERAAALAVCYVSARLGELLSRGEAFDLTRFDPRTGLDAAPHPEAEPEAGPQPDPDYFQLAAHIDTLPALARFLDVLHGPDLVRAVQNLLDGLRKPA